MDTSRYAQLFLSEGRDLVARLNESLLALERDADAATHVPALFRAMHTMKGMAAAMGYEAIAAASHAAEEVLAGVRDAGQVPDVALLDALFATADWLEAELTRLEADGDGATADASDIVARLHAAARPGTAHGSPGARRIVVRLVADAPLAGVRALMLLQRARTLGTVRDVEPDEAALREDRHGGLLALTLESAEPDEAVEAALRAVGEVDTLTITPERATPTAGTPAARPAERTTPERPVASVGRESSVVRVELRRLDALMTLTGELVIARGRVQERAAALGDPALLDAAAQLDRLVAELQAEVLATRMVPTALVLDRFPRFVRDAARALGKEVRFVMEGRDIELDRALLEELGEPLVHLLRNALDHGLEPTGERVAAGKPAAGTLTLAVTRERDSVVIRVSDDGRGVDRQAVLRRAREAGLVGADVTELADDDLLRLLATSGLSTRERVTELSGRGVGVDAVLATVRRLGGTVDLRTTEGEGTTWSLRLPATLAIVRAVLARVADETYALPATHVRATADLGDATVATVRGRDVVVLGEDVLPVVRLREVVGLPAADDAPQDVVVLAAEDRRVGLLVDELIAQEEIVVKPFDAARDGARLFSGATVLADGAPALIVDVGSLL